MSLRINIHVIFDISSICLYNIYTQERRLKRLITLGGLEIGIQHQIVKALELSTHPPPPQKKKEKN